MGVVFLANAGSQSVALKVVRSSYLDNTSLHSRFIREIETLKRIDSPHVAKILDYAVEQDTAWHAVEFVSGPTLKEKVEADGPLGAAAWNTLALELQSALSDIHKLGIVHRDLKPANIVLGESGTKLIDFGIAQDDDATSLTATGSVTGSPAWLSPERLEGKEDTPASDLFSAGAVLTFAGTGRSPWGKSDATTVSSVITRIIAGTPDLTGLSPSQESMVRGLLDPEPLVRSWNVPVPVPPAATSPVQKIQPQEISPKRETWCSCSRWQRGLGNTQYKNGRDYCLRCADPIRPVVRERTELGWRVFLRGLGPSLLVLFAAITLTNFFYISPFAAAGTSLFLLGLISSFVLLVRSCVFYRDRLSSLAVFGLFLLGLAVWSFFGFVVFVVEIFLFDWLYWGQYS